MNKISTTNKILICIATVVAIVVVYNVVKKTSFDFPSGTRVIRFFKDDGVTSAGGDWNIEENGKITKF
jgi:hypothetical protein